MTFHLRPEVDEDDFLLADRAVQQAFAYQQPGLMRRTTARGSNGSWVVVDVWRSAEDSDASERNWDADPVAQKLMSLIDRDTFSSERYHELD